MGESETYNVEDRKKDKGEIDANDARVDPPLAAATLTRGAARITYTANTPPKGHRKFHISRDRLESKI